MGLFNNFPWTNLHELNLQWIVETLKKCYSPDNPPESMVISVNGASGVVTLYPDAVIRFPDVQDTQWNMWRNTDGVSTGIQFEKGQPAKRIDGQSRIVIYDANNPPPYPVVSVNGETGEIELYTEAYVEFPDIEGDNWGIQRKLNAGTENETQVGIMFDDTGKAKIIKDEDSNDLYSENNPPPYPVTRVDGNTGDVNTWGYNATSKINIPLPAPGDDWAIGREINQGGNLSIKIMYDDNIQKCTAYMIYDDGVNTPTPVKLLTLDDIPSSSGVVSINNKTGVVTLTGDDIIITVGSNETIPVALQRLEGAISGAVQRLEGDISDNVQRLEGDISDNATNIQNLERELNNNTWIPLTLKNGTTAPSWEVPAYCKIGKMIFIHGAIYYPSASAGVVMFTMPEGTRPRQNIEEIVAKNLSNHYANLNIDHNGDVSLVDVVENGAMYHINLCYITRD